VIDTGNYLHAVRVTGSEGSGDGFTVRVEAPEAEGYAGAIRRKGESGYVGQRVAEQGIEAAEGDIRAALDKAGKKVQG
jgi:hypothetical protein